MTVNKLICEALVRAPPVGSSRRLHPPPLHSPPPAAGRDVDGLFVKCLSTRSRVKTEAVPPGRGPCLPNQFIGSRGGTPPATLNLFPASPPPAAQPFPCDKPGHAKTLILHLLRKKRKTPEKTSSQAVRGFYIFYPKKVCQRGAGRGARRGARGEDRSQKTVF